MKGMKGGKMTKLPTHKELLYLPTHKADEPLQDSVTMGIPLPKGEGFIKETVRIEYGWKPPRCEQCKIFGHMDDQCPKKAATTPNVVNNDGFQTVVNKKKSGKTGPTVVKTTWQPIKQKVRFDLKSHGDSQNANDGNTYHPSESIVHTSNPYDAPDNMESDEYVEVVFDETTNLLGNNITRATYTALDASKT
ncbi:zinc knuckle CX2CX4HX4C containing protein [Tanacetum coccineum]